MSIATLSTKSTSLFRGGAKLTGAGSTALVGVINTMIAKVNELVNGLNAGTCDTLTVGTPGGGTYYGTTNSWMVIDGTNPPTVSRMRFMDTATGGYRTVHVNGGAVQVI